MKQLMTKLVLASLVLVMSSIIAAIPVDSVSAATNTSVFIQAEGMSPNSQLAAQIPDSNATGNARMFTGNATIHSTTVLSHEARSLKIRARGHSCQGAAPRMNVAIDGRNVSTLSIGATSYRDYTISAKLAPGTHTIALSNTNYIDSAKGKCRRLLMIDQTTITMVTPKQGTPTKQKSTAKQPAAAQKKSTAKNPPNKSSGKSKKQSEQSSTKKNNQTSQSSSSKKQASSSKNTSSTVPKSKLDSTSSSKKSPKSSPKKSAKKAKQNKAPVKQSNPKSKSTRKQSSQKNQATEKAVGTKTARAQQSTTTKKSASKKNTTKKSNAKKKQAKTNNPMVKVPVAVAATIANGVSNTTKPSSNRTIKSGKPTVIMIGWRTEQEQNYAHLRNQNVDLVYRTAIDYSPRSTSIQRWESQGQPYLYTVAASDKASAGGGLYVSSDDAITALSQNYNRGLYMHEVAAYNAAKNGWQWQSAADGIDWGRLNSMAYQAQQRGKKVIWSEPAQGWQAIRQSNQGKLFLTTWGDTIVPMYATNFRTSSFDHVPEARAGAIAAAQDAGSTVGASIQSWHFREYPENPTTENTLNLLSQARGAGATYYQIEGTYQDMAWDTTYMQAIYQFTQRL